MKEQPQRVWDKIDEETLGIFGHRTPTSRRLMVRDGLKNVHPEFDNLFKKEKKQ
jgi:hypothetical protein